MKKISPSALDSLLELVNKYIPDEKLILSSGYGKYQLLLENPGGSVERSITGLMTTRALYDWLWAHLAGIRRTFQYIDRKSMNALIEER